MTGSGAEARPPPSGTMISPAPLMSWNENLSEWTRVNSWNRLLPVDEFRSVWATLETVALNSCSALLRIRVAAAL